MPADVKEGIFKQAYSRPEVPPRVIIASAIFGIISRLKLSGNIFTFFFASTDYIFIFFI